MGSAAREPGHSLRYRLMRAKLEVLSSDDPERALAHFKSAFEDGEHGNLAATAYGVGLSLARTGARDAAREVFVRLMERHPTELAFRIAAADNELAAGRNAKSLELLAEAYDRYPSSRALVLGFAGALVQSRRSEEVLAIIDTFARHQAMDHRLHRLAAEAYAQLGEPSRSQLSLAEHYYLRGRIDAAIYQLELAAQDRDAGYYLLSRVEARLDELEEERRQRARSGA